MPRVPTYDGPQVRDAALPGSYLEQVDVTRNQRALAGALVDTAKELDAYQQRRDQEDAFDVEARLKEEWLTFEADLRANSKGRDAATYDADVKKWWDDAAQRYGKDLTPGAKRQVSQRLTTSRLQALAGAESYKAQQLNAAGEASYRATQSLAIEEAVRIGSPEAVAKALVDMRARAAQRGAAEGWAPEQLQRENLIHSTVLHASVLDQMVLRDPAAAKAYFARVSSAGEIDAKASEHIRAKLEQQSALVEGNAAAEEVWAKFGPRNLNAPIDEAGMQAKLREKYANDPTRLKAAQSALKEMTAAHDKSQAEAKAANVSTVYQQLDGGVPLSKVRLTEAWRSLPGDVQNNITRDRQSQALTASQIELTSLQRANALALLRNPDAYLQYSDPAVLARMSRAQVQALRPELGLDATEQLTKRWDALQKPAERLEARIDQEDFNHVADSLGLSPYRANTEDKKRQLGELKYRIETMIDKAQSEAKRKLTREEKMGMMRDAMARTVSVPTWFGLSSKEVPAVLVPDKEVESIIVPDADRNAIIEALEGAYKRTGSNAFAPTDENIRRLYLENKRAGAPR